MPSISVPNLKFLALTVQVILGGPEIPKVGISVPNLKFLALAIPEILGVSEFQKWVT